MRDGAGAPRHPLADALRRLDRPGPLAGSRRDDRRPVRGDRRPRGRDDDRRGAALARGRGEPRAPAPAAGSSPPTRWPARSRRWGSRPPARRWSRPRTPRSRRSPSGSASSRSGCSPRTCGRAGSSPASRSRTRSPSSARRAARPTGCSTCWRSPARPGSRWRWTTSSGSPGSTPLLADLKPGGRFVATDLYRAGGVPLILKRLAEAGILNADALTVTGRTIGEEAADAREEPGPGGRAPAVGPAEAGGRARDPARQPRARRLGGEARRHRAARADRAGAGVRVRGGLLPRRQGPEASARATWS